MRTKISWIVSAAAAVSLLSVLIAGGQWTAFFLAVALCGCFCILIKNDRRETARQLAQVSDLLELLLQKKRVPGGLSGEDTLFEKIAAQIQRIDEIHDHYEKALEKNHNDLKRLLAEIAHQLRTPLANAEAYLALLREASSDEERERYLRSVEQAQHKISFLTERFLLASRMENKLIQIHKCGQNLKETVAEAVFQVYQKAESRGIRIAVEEQPGLTLKNIPHDRHWICESVYNLLDNSVKYSPEHSEIRVCLKDNEMFTEICVEDEGAGISPDDENRIFGLYYRGENARAEEGFGMGLFITREIVRRHGGFMRVKRREKGLGMSIFLPKNLGIN